MTCSCARISSRASGRKGDSRASAVPDNCPILLMSSRQLTADECYCPIAMLSSICVQTRSASDSRSTTDSLYAYS